MRSVLDRQLSGAGHSKKPPLVWLIIAAKARRPCAAKRHAGGSGSSANLSLNMLYSERPAENSTPLQTPTPSPIGSAQPSHNVKFRSVGEVSPQICDHRLRGRRNFCGGQPRCHFERCYSCSAVAGRGCSKIRRLTQTRYND